MENSFQDVDWQGNKGLLDHRFANEGWDEVALKTESQRIYFSKRP